MGEVFLAFLRIRTRFPHSLHSSTNSFIKKQAISRILCTLNLFQGLPLIKSKLLIIYLDFRLPESSNRLPFSLGVQPSNTDLHDVAPHRVYLISLQPYLYLLSVALVLSLPLTRRTGVTRYAALWCPDFPPWTRINPVHSDKVTCLLQI